MCCAHNPCARACIITERERERLSNNREGGTEKSAVNDKLFHDFSFGLAGVQLVQRRDHVEVGARR